MENLITVMVNYLMGLDWSYIMTFILLTYLATSSIVKREMFYVFGIKVRTRFVVAIIGIVWASLLYVMRGRTPGLAENLIHSFVFAIVFHKIILDTIVQYFKPKVPAPPEEPDASDSSI